MESLDSTKNIHDTENNQEPRLAYPETKHIDFSYDMHGEAVHDPYQWLEDETSDEVLEWVNEQNLLVEDYFKYHDSEDIYQDLIAESDTFGRSSPSRRGEYYFWSEHQPGQRYNTLYKAKNPWTEEDKEVVSDPNQLAEDEDESFFSISREGNYAVYGVQKGGSERSEIYIYNLNTGEKESFYYGRTFGISWKKDESGFYYTRSDYLNHGGDIRDETHYSQVYLHKLGDKREDDELIFDATKHEYPKDAGVSANESDDGRFIALNVRVGWDKSYMHLIDAETKESKTIAVPEESNSSISLIDGYVELTTNHEAKNYRILRTEYENADKPLVEWEEYIAEDPERKLSGRITTKNERLLVYSHNACDQIERHDRHTGAHLSSLDMPEIATVGSITAHKEDEDFFYSVMTFLSPSAKYYFNPQTESSELFFQKEGYLDEAEYDAEQRWYESKDGTSVPMFLVAPKGYEDRIDNPVLMTGYGGFNNSQKPAYIGGLKPWLESGGIFVAPSLRGGGEFGDEWHDAGKRENKQNTFDDFIAAAEYLIGQDITQPKRIAIRGGSNGGLLVGAAMTQRPELFGAVVCGVPLLDMYRYHNLLLAHRWTREYGNPDVPEEFDWLRAYSPYQHVHADVAYPSIMITTGINDSRVHPMHAWKMAAKLQNGSTENRVLMHTQTDAGHTGQLGLQKGLEEKAKQLKFMMDEVGMDSVKQSAKASDV